MTELLKASPAAIDYAATLLGKHQLVAFGTETVYGLGGDATSAKAVARIYEAKRRPLFNPLICHFASAEKAFAHVVVSSAAQDLAEAFWPGPLTMILPRHHNSAVCSLATAGLQSLALRVPRSEPVLALLAAVDRPVAAPSANLSGHISPTTASHVYAGLAGRIEAILDTGPCSVGVESTVVDLTEPTPRLLRPGSITPEALTQVVGSLRASESGTTTRPLSPGQLSSHYAPSLPLRLDAAHVESHEALLAFGVALQGTDTVWNLSENGNLAEAATRLFEGLHYLDTIGKRRGLHGIAAMPLPSLGLGLALNDRLRRAAAPKSSAS